MTTKMKGLLKGLRYISQIFDNVDKEPEMQIGLPTDVKHVAHIGWDGLSVNTPSWMNEYNTNPELPSGSLNSISEALEKSVSKRSKEGIQGTLLENFADMQKSLRYHPSPGSPSPSQSPTRHLPGSPKQSRRHRSSGSSVDSPTRDPTGITRPSRRHQQSLSLGLASPSHDPQTIPKKSRRKKSKGSSGGGSTRSSRSKGQNSLTDPFSESAFGFGSGLGLKNSVLEVFEEEQECDEISTGVRAL